jgi:hypothetical protein
MPVPGIELPSQWIATGHVERWYEADVPVAGPSPVSMLSPDADAHVLIETGGDSAPRLGLVVGPDQFRPLDVPVGFPNVNEGYLQDPGWAAADWRSMPRAAGCGS